MPYPHRPLSFVNQERHDRIMATAMILGDHKPIICSCCMGHRVQSGLFGSWRTCAQCWGRGFDIIPTKTEKALLKQGMDL